jgi:TusA-related sulfurtransferase
VRQQLIEAARAHFASHIQKHRMNVEIMLNNPMAIHDHTDWMTAMEIEIGQIAEYQDKLEMLDKYFAK